MAFVPADEKIEPGNFCLWRDSDLPQCPVSGRYGMVSGP
jgi:hypothetical protein